ncbi:MAG: hypothetical protein V3U24_02920 [Candidatus Neomarinimicrobiota bacterium]
MINKIIKDSSRQSGNTPVLPKPAVKFANIVFAKDEKTLPSGEAVRETVPRIVNERKIPVMDIHEKVFVPHPDPLSLFPLRMLGHYTTEGWRHAEETIAKRVKAYGNIPLK